MFDPVHTGHLALAARARRALRLDRVIFLPDGNPPGGKRPVAPARHRVQMLRIALARSRRPWLRLDLRQLRRRGPSYTILALEEYRRRHPSAEIFLLCGADARPRIRFWKKGRKILQRFRVWSMPRVGGISSTRIRSALSAGRRPTGLPRQLSAYIRRHRLYR